MSSSSSSSSSGLEQKIGSLSQLKVKGLVVGPIHVAPADEAMSLRFEEISPEAGNLEQFRGLVQAAHKKGEHKHSCVHISWKHQQSLVIKVSNIKSFDMKV